MSNKKVINSFLKEILDISANKIEYATKLFFMCRPHHHALICHMTGFQGIITVENIREHFDTLELLDQLPNLIEELESDLMLNGTNETKTIRYAATDSSEKLPEFEESIAKLAKLKLPFFGELNFPDVSQWPRQSGKTTRIKTIDYSRVTHLVTDVHSTDDCIDIEYIPVSNDLLPLDISSNYKFVPRTTVDKSNLDSSNEIHIKLITFDLVKFDTKLYSNGS